MTKEKLEILNETIIVIDETFDEAKDYFIKNQKFELNDIKLLKDLIMDRLYSLKERLNISEEDLKGGDDDDLS